MKTKLYITILLLTMSLSTTLAKTGSDEIAKGPVDVNVVVDLSRFAPVVPLMAGFEDGFSVYVTDFPMIKWAPVVPNVADFEDIVPEPAPAYIIAAPSAPKEATFDDEYAPENNNIPDDILKSLAPVAPREADFDEDNVDIPVNLAPTTPRTADFTELL